MGKIIKVGVVDESGKGVVGVSVAIAGTTNELKTNADGLTQFLLDDGPFEVALNGKSAFKGKADSAPDTLKFKQAGGAFTKL